jgi:hypothetical protein
MIKKSLSIMSLFAARLLAISVAVDSSRYRGRYLAILMAISVLRASVHIQQFCARRGLISFSI